MADILTRDEVKINADWIKPIREIPIEERRLFEENAPRKGGVVVLLWEKLSMGLSAVGTDGQLGSSDAQQLECGDNFVSVSRHVSPGPMPKHSNVINTPLSLNSYTTF